MMYISFRTFKDKVVKILIFQFQSELAEVATCTVYVNDLYIKRLKPVKVQTVLVSI